MDYSPDCYVILIMRMGHKSKGSKSPQVVVEGTENTTSTRWGIFFNFKLNFNTKIEFNQPQNNQDLNQGILHLWSKFGDHSLTEWWVFVRTSSWLIYTHTHTHTDTPTQATTAKTGPGWKKSWIDTNTPLNLLNDIKFKHLCCLCGKLEQHLTNKREVTTVVTWLQKRKLELRNLKKGACGKPSRDRTLTKMDYLQSQHGSDYIHFKVWDKLMVIPLKFGNG